MTDNNNDNTTGKDKEAHYQQLMMSAMSQLKKMQGRLSEQEAKKHEPIAIVGIGCRYPGNINNKEDFWRAMVEEKDAIVDASKRWNMQRVYDPDPMTPGRMYSRHLGLVDNVAEFDADFFGISPREAECIDPQQRILLETSWQALEDAGYHLRQLQELNMGVYIGIGMFDYAFLRSHAMRPESISTYDGTGTALSVAAGRISYTFGLQGPSMAVETACSSSLVASHLAVKALRSGEIDAALCGGVNSLLNPAISVMFSKGMMLSPDGRCRAFDKNGNGYVRSEGCGVVILKRLSDAIRDGNQITAVIKGSAINQDGRSQGIVAPNENAQRQVLEAALKDAKVKPDQVDYIEAHGTGTALGDPIEVNALASVYKGTPRREKLRISSVKTNIGHCESAAGVAGLIKLALSIKHQVQPALLHFSEPNPFIPWPSIPITVANEARPWTSPERTGGVSSFGFSGTNAHMILQAAPEPEVQQALLQQDLPKQESGHWAPTDQPFEGRRWPLTLSAKSAAALNTMVELYGQQLDDSMPFPQWCYSSNRNRGQMEHRLTLMATDHQDARELLQQAKQNQPSPFWSKAVCTYRKPAIAFVFAGQGPQFVGMGKKLYEQLPIVRQHIDACEAHLATLWEPKLTDILWGEQSALLDQTQYTQAALFSLQTACARWWMAMGVEPKRLLGHSFGEYAAAYVAGVFSLEDALTLLVARGGLPQQLESKGAMLSIQAGTVDIDPQVQAKSAQLHYAAINSDHSVVVSGTEAAIAELETFCADSSIDCQRLRVSQGFHSQLMEPILDQFRAVAQSIQLNKPVKPLISCVTGGLIQAEITDPEYWVTHLRDTVQFAKGVKTLHKAKPEIFLEMGPGSTVLGLVRQHFETEDLMYLPSFRQQHDEIETLTLSAVQLHQQGAIKQWEALYPAGIRYSDRLPHYPFQRSLYWFKVDDKGSDGLSSTEFMYAFAQYAANNQQSVSKQATNLSTSSQQMAAQQAATAARTHKLFSQQIQHPLLNQVLFDVQLNTSVLPQLKEYKLFGESILSRGLLISLLYGALHHLQKGTTWELQQLKFPSLFHLEDQVDTLHLVLTQQAAGYRAELLVQQEGHNKILFQTDVAPLDAAVRPAVDIIAEPEQFRLHTDNLIQRKRLYEQMLDQQHVFAGTEYQWMDSVWPGEGTLLANLAMPTSVQSDSTFTLHPGLVESAFQALFAHPGWAEQLMLANSIERMVWYRRGASTRSNLMISWPAGKSGAAIGVQINDQQGQRVLDMSGVQLQRLDHSEFLRELGDHPSGRHYQIHWVPKPDIELPSTPLGRLLLVVTPAQANKPVPTWLSDVLAKTEQNYLWVNNPGGEKQPDQVDDSWINLLTTVDTLDLTAAESIAAAVEQWTDFGFKPDALLYLGSNDLADLPAESSQQHLHSLLNLAQQYGNWPAAPMRTLLVTTTGESIEPGNGALRGMAKTWQLELPHYPMLHIDLDEAACNSAATWLSQLPESGSAELQWQLREHQILVPRLRAWDCEETKLPIQCQANAIYLITGGLGALGMVTAQWLIDNGAKQLCLVGRRQPSADVQQRLDHWIAQGVQVQVQQVDISQGAEVDALFASLASNDAPIKGIFHCAGAVADTLLLRQNWDNFASILAAKMQGTWWLDQASQGLSLDYFVGYSSTSAVMGNPGQANYAAANEFMNAIIAKRQQQGLAGQTVHWGPWAGIGLAANLETHDKDHFSKRGVVPLTIEQAEISFSQLLQQGANDVMVFDVAWEKALQDWPLSLEDGFICEIAQTVSLLLNYQQLNHKLIGMLEQQTPEQRQLLVLRYMETQLQNVLNCKEVDVDKSVMSLGIDSLMAMEFRSQMKRELALDVPVAELLRGPSIRELATLVSEQFTADYFQRVSSGEEVEEKPTDELLKLGDWKQNASETVESEFSDDEQEMEL